MNAVIHIQQVINTAVVDVVSHKRNQKHLLRAFMLLQLLHFYNKTNFVRK